MEFLHVVTLPVHARVLTSALRRPLQTQVRVPLVKLPRGQRGQGDLFTLRATIRDSAPNVNACIMGRARDRTSRPCNNTLINKYIARKRRMISQMDA